MRYPPISLLKIQATTSPISNVAGRYVWVLAAADPVGDGAEQRAGLARGLGDGGEQVSGRRLPFGAGDGSEREVTPGMAVEGGRRLGDGAARVGDLDPDGLGGEIRRSRRCREDRDRALADRVSREAGAVGTGAADGDEEPARLDLARVIGDDGYFRV